MNQDAGAGERFSSRVRIEVRTEVRTMPSEFNPYREWLGVDVSGQTPNYYQLLGVPDFEANPEALWAAAYQRRALLRAEQYGDHSELAKRLLDEVDAAEA